MALDQQVVGVNFTKGLNTRDDPRLLIPGELVQLDNATTSKEGTIVRRDGNAQIVALSGGQGLATYDNELLALASNALSSYSPGAAALIGRGPLHGLTLAKAELRHSATQEEEAYDCAYDSASGLVCYVYRSWTVAGPEGLFAMVQDHATGAVILAETQITNSSNAVCPKVVALTNCFVIFYTNGNNLHARVIATNAPTTIGTVANLRADAAGTSAVALDACASAANTAEVIYLSNDATGAIRSIAVQVSGTTPSVVAGPFNVLTVAYLGAGAIKSMAVASFAAGGSMLAAVLISGGANTGLSTAILATSAVVTVGLTMQDAAAVGGATTAALNGTSMYVFTDGQGERAITSATTTPLPIRASSYTSANAVVVAPATIQNSFTRANGTTGPWIAGKAFTLGGTTYLPTNVVEAGTGSLQNLWLLLDGSAAATGSACAPIAARALYGTQAGFTSNNGFSPAVNMPAPLSIGTTTETLTGNRTILAFNSALINISRTGICRLIIRPESAPPAVELGRSTYCATAGLRTYEGAAPTEAAFPLFPEVVAVARSGGGALPDGAYQYVALYEWIDAQGQRWQSAPSVAVTGTASGGGSAFNVTVPSLVLGAKNGTVAATTNGPPYIVIYRTKVNGTTFYRVPIAGALGTANTTTVSVVVIPDQAADSTLGEVLYTEGGILPNNAPAPASVVWIHQNRIWTDVGDDPGAFRFSQPAVIGFGLQFNETLGGRIGEAITAGASMDDKCIIFSATKPYIIFGNGPGTTGLGGSYSSPEPLSADVGCVEPRSVLLLPTGLLFKSSKGWYLLGRDLQVRYVGKGVEQYNSQGVTSAVLLLDRQEVRFTTNDANGRTLVFSYVSDDWSTFSSQVSVDAAWWTGGSAYVRLTSAGLVQDLPPTTATHALGAGFTYGDGAVGQSGTGTPYPQTGSAIPLTIRTGWLKPGDALAGFQRIWWSVFTGLAAGKPPTASTTVSGFQAASTLTLTVASTSGFPSTGTIYIGLGTSTYESRTYTVTDATTLTLVLATTYDHADGVPVRTSTAAVGATGTLAISLYTDGNDTTPTTTLTVADVSALVADDVWHFRIKPVVQKCEAIQVQLVSTPSVTDPGASLNFSGMSFEAGVKKGARRSPAAQTG